MDLNNIPDALTLPLRLKLLCALVSGQKSFGELKELVKATDGNISVQLSKLEEWGYITAQKAFVKKRPKSTYELTPFGLGQLEEYVAFLRSIVE